MNTRLNFFIFFCWWEKLSPNSLNVVAHPKPYLSLRDERVGRYFSTKGFLKPCGESLFPCHSHQLGTPDCSGLALFSFPPLPALGLPPLSPGKADFLQPCLGCLGSAFAAPVPGECCKALGWPVEEARRGGTHTMHLACMTCSSLVSLGETILLSSFLKFKGENGD